MSSKSNTQAMETEKIPRLLAQLAIPAVVAQIINLLYNIVDRIYIGHIPGVGAAALTGVGLFTPILMLINAFAMLAGSGGAPRAAISMGKKDNAIFLDTSDLSFEYAPIVLDGAKIVVTNSMVKHSLVTSAYNDRRNESAQALKDLQTVVDIKTLGDLTDEQFEQYKGAIKDEVARKRGKHAVYENQRTIAAVRALKENDIETFGKLMNASHVSLRDDYETSCPEVDVLVDEAWKIPGVIGSRITGGGFGGCTVSIVKDASVDEFKEKLTKAYEEKVGKTPDFYVVSIGDGPSRLI